MTSNIINASNFDHGFIASENADACQTHKKRAALPPYKGNDPYIFVSYAHRDSDAVMPIIEKLQQNHYRVWYDEGIDPGTEWDENIATHLEKCYCFVAFLSNAYLKSSNCKDELNYARDLDKPRLLVYLEDIDLPGGMRMRLNRLQAIHMYKYENVRDFYQKLYEFSAMQNCKEIPEHSESTTPAELTIYHNHTRYNGRLIAEGFACCVYKAYDEARREDVVFKVYHLLNAFRVPLIARCDLEADMEKLDNAHLGRVIGVVRDAAPAVIMEYIAGKTLSQHIKDTKPTISEGLKFTWQVLDGLNALHKKGIFYGDVTPYNLIVSDNQVVLCDYSETNYNGSRYDSLTMMLHKYRSPERNPGKNLDFRSDLYEAGMILDTLTLNAVSEDYATEMSIFQKPIIMQKPENLSPVEEKIYAIIEKATKANPEERYDSAATMMHAIEEVLALL